MTAEKCLDEVIMTGYIEGRLDPTQQEKVEDHLSRCLFCLDAIVTVRRAMLAGDDTALEKVPEAVTNQAMDLVKRHSRQDKPSGKVNKESWYGEILRKANSLVETHLTGPFPGAEPVAVRSPKGGHGSGSAEGVVQLIKTFAGFEAMIEMEKVSEGKAVIRVHLSHRSKTETVRRITLRRGQRELVSQLYEGEKLAFEDVSYGSYNLEFRGDGKTSLGEYGFEIKETTNDHG